MGASRARAPLPCRRTPVRLQYHYAVGARISSDSWGFQSSAGIAYTAESQEYDKFSWRNPDFLSCIAAGNNGARAPVLRSHGVAVAGEDCMAVATMGF